jgi:hypothetical protein
VTLPPCATAARDRRDPLAGTAAPARRWLLVEYPGPWAPAALDSRCFGADVAARLGRAAAAAHGRVLLIRRPGRRPRTERWRWGVLDHGGSAQWGTWRRDVELVEAAELLEAPAVAEPTGGAGRADPLLLVCAHALHDTCCAVRGRPVAAALAARWPEATWECSHVGGDRFAANLLVLPDGTCYGNLSDATAVQVAGDHLAGLVTPDHLRGPSTEPPVVQAAVVAAHAHLGPGGPRDLVGAGITAVDADTWRVRLAGRGALPEAVEATVTRHRRPPARLTCRAAGDAVAHGYDVTDLRVPS